MPAFVTFVLAIFLTIVGGLYLGVPVVMGGVCVVSDYFCGVSQKQFKRLGDGTPFGGFPTPTHAPPSAVSPPGRTPAATGWAHVKTVDGREVIRWRGTLWHMQKKPSTGAYVCSKGPDTIGWCD